MSQLKVIRASAGSGKTYRLTSDYLRLLFRYPKNYKHILAVTFTNKATEEMKTRIIAELFKLSHDINSNHATYLSKEFNLTQTEIQEKSNIILENILHNYSRFTISTIDSFFQRIVKSFAREAGLQYNFEVELDINNVIEKATDQLLLKLENDKTLLEWLVQYAEQRIEEGKNWDFKKEILKLGKELFNEKFNSLDNSFHKKLHEREGLKDFQKQLYAVCNSFESAFKKAGIEGMNIISVHGLEPADFKFGIQSGVGQYFLKLSMGDEFPFPSKRILDASETLDNWIPKGLEESIKIQSAADAGLFKLLQEVINLYTEKYILYKSAKEVLTSFFNLGILADLSREVNEYTSRKNIFMLASSGVFLRSIINENDTPFIYEKTGQNIYHYMIDEFQDTSAIQWHNFLPLINNSLSENHECMVVGDIKQSIYRWRNTDWKIMATQLEKDVSGFGTHFDDLIINWRSKSNIIAFNNTFFSQASGILQQSFNLALPEGRESEKEFDFFKQIIIHAYEGCMQKLPSGIKSNEGNVKVQFIENQDKEWKTRVLSLLPSVIENLQKSGNRLKDIVILVRTAAEGREVADYLNSYQENVPTNHPFKYQVLSNESTFLINAPVIAFIIKLFKFLSTPEDEINSASLAYDYECFFKETDLLKSKKISSDNSIPFDRTQRSTANSQLATANNHQPTTNNYISFLPSEFVEKIEQLKNLPPDELFEYLVLIFGLNKKVSDLPFIQAFHDCIVDFLENNSANQSAFLEYWEEKKEKLSVSVSEDQDAIKVMTIHKSKGLEFKNVIVPFCNWNLDHNWPNTPIIWCNSNVPPFSQLEFLPLRYSSELKDTVFSSNYYLEKAQSYVDNLNLLYVAFTRSSDNLFAFAPLPVKEEKLSTTGELIYNWIKTNIQPENSTYPIINISECWNDNESFLAVGKIEKSILSKNTGTSELPLIAYPNNELKEKLRQRYSYPGFWDTLDNKRPPVRIYGNLMHRLFQEIRTTNDIDGAIDKLIFQGLIKEADKPAMSNEVKTLLSEKPFTDWFNGHWTVLNEAGIFVPSEHLYRPDRVMIKDEETLVVDYKFGKIQDSRYNIQVKRYVNYLREMGYSKAEGIIWYVNLNVLERV